MKILRDSVFNELPQHSTIFLDTNILITAFNSVEYLREVISLLQEHGYELVTTSEVFLEFVRTAQNETQFIKRQKFVMSLVTRIIDSPKIEGSYYLYAIILFGQNKDIDFVDLLLQITLCFFPPQESFVLTQNHKHFPLSIFLRVGLIVVDNDSQIHTHALYQINSSKMMVHMRNLKMG